MFFPRKHDIHHSFYRIIHLVYCNFNTIAHFFKGQQYIFQKYVILVIVRGIPFLRKSHGGCGVPPAPRQEPPFESHSTNIHAQKRRTRPLDVSSFWRREWDSNPRILAYRRFSRPEPSTTRPSLRISGVYFIINPAQGQSWILPEMSVTSMRQTETWGYWAM